MASKFSKVAAEKAFRFQGYRFSDTEIAGIARQLDAELQEVREVLATVAPFEVDGSPCWCPERGGGYTQMRAIDDHDDECQLARNLMERMKP